MKRLLAFIALIVLSSVALAQDPQPLTLEEAIALALERNGEIVVERESLLIAGATLERAEAAYEPTLRGDARLRERTDPARRAPDRSWPSCRARRTST